VKIWHFSKFSLTFLFFTHLNYYYLSYFLI